MRLDIEPEVFASADPVATIDLIILTLDGRHEWQPSLPVASAAVQFVARQVPALSEYMQKVLVEAANPATPAAAVAKVRAGDLRAVLADLSKPAVLVVENRIGDGGFVRAVAAALRDQRIVDALRGDNDWLRLSNGGGCGQMPDLAAEECRAFSMLVRVAVLFDSDRVEPDEPSPHHDKVAKCREAGVREVHLLTWRMMENYVPFPVWERHFPARSNQIEELRTRIPRQRGYQNLKDEFGRRNMPKRMFPDDLPLTEEDFAELGPGVVTELRELLAMIHRIL
ncbi:hypothetical protein ACIBD9_10235 [Micromonospora sp. NPDC050784]|uniref:hypothetical protein n=1 Tax=Micromonospora sp. NPDC050784 TaxID=3364281 RepID=UPI003799C834